MFVHTKYYSLFGLIEVSNAFYSGTRISLIGPSA